MLSWEIIWLVCYYDECCWKLVVLSFIRLCGRIIRSYGLGLYYYWIYIMYKFD